ncbi:GntR family transcriptional regulator [Streptomyces sp. NBC_01283]|uniref:GntR family transcriptional regulator n=1 Tax=Streptomyces sp. NBC_01283 TaxID=2903812 RepID=UPI00352E107B
MSSAYLLDIPGQVHEHHRVAHVLADEIRAGVHADGSRLPGEHALRERFGVSRTTVRQALSALGEQGFIETHAGIGSIVTFDGTPLDQQLGWTRALAEAGGRAAPGVPRSVSARSKPGAASGPPAPGLPWPPG